MYSSTKNIKKGDNYLNGKLCFVNKKMKPNILSSIKMSTYVWLVKLLDLETIPIRLSLGIAPVDALKISIIQIIGFL